MIHPSADVQSKNIGPSTRVWQNCVILADAVIGDECNINFNVFIENDVQVGDRVTIKSGVQLWDGIRIQNDVFIGPNATFTNDLYPRSKQFPDHFPKTIIKRGATIGANATILPNITIGEYALIGAGSVITKNVAAYSLVFGNPAVHKAWIDQKGNKLQEVDSETWKSIDGTLFKKDKNGLTRIA